VVTIGIGNENLSEAVAGHQAHYLFHTTSIQLVEDIV
jgi:hypothetical protein